LSPVNNTLNAQGHKSQSLSRFEPSRLPGVYDPAFINAAADLVAVGTGMMSAKCGRLCLYGPWSADKGDSCKIIPISGSIRNDSRTRRPSPKEKRPSASYVTKSNSRGQVVKEVEGKFRITATVVESVLLDRWLLAHSPEISKLKRMAA
jgi:hypothetical protein